MNAKEKRILGRAPEALQKIIALLPERWKVERHSPLPMGWEADISFGKQLFKLVEERTYIDVSVMKDGTMNAIEPPEDQRISISPKQVCALLLKASK